MLRKLISRFHQTQSDVLTRIQVALDRRDTDTAKREAHTLRGLAGNIGAWRVAELAEVVEGLLHHGDSGELTAGLEGLRQEHSGLLARIFAHENAHDAAFEGDTDTDGQIGEIDRVRVAEDLRGLAVLLQADDSQARKAGDTLMATLESVGQAESAHEMQKLLAAYDFDGALGVLQEVAQALEIAL